MYVQTEASEKKTSEAEAFERAWERRSGKPSPGSQIALWSSWRGCGGGLQLFDELRSAGQKERQKSSSAEALELMVQQRPAERCCQSLHEDRLQVHTRGNGGLEPAQ